MNATDSLSLVVPVLPMSGRCQPAALAAAADVPSVVSFARPAARVCARPGLTTCSHGCCATATGLPSRSVTDWIGLGGHHTPPDRIVAVTLAISSGLTGLTPRVNESRPWKYCDCGSSYCGLRESGSAGSVTGSLPAALDARVWRSPSRCAICTTAGMPVRPSRSTNATLGEVARASGREIGSA